MVTIILGIIAAVEIPRYTATVTKAEADAAVITSIKAGLETYATEQLKGLLILRVNGQLILRVNGHSILEV